MPAILENTSVGDDPSVMTILRQITRGYILLPAPPRDLSITSGFSSEQAQLINGQPFLASSASPFQQDARGAHKLHYLRADNCRGSYFSNQSQARSRRTEHLSVHLGVSVGCSLLGASVTGHYDKAILENKDSLVISRRCTYRAGTISLASPPQLTKSSLELIIQEGGLETFHKTYGDFYIAALKVGGDAAVCLSTSSALASASSDVNVIAKVEVLFMSDEETIADNHTKEEVESSMFKVIAHDSVSQTNLLRKGEQGQGVSFQEAKRLVKEFGEKVDRLEMNVEDELERWETRLKEKAVQWDAIQELWRAGLVVEILLLPFAKLREVRNVLLNQKSGANV